MIKSSQMRQGRQKKILLAAWLACLQGVPPWDRLRSRSRKRTALLGTEELHCSGVALSTREHCVAADSSSASVHITSEHIAPFLTLPSSRWESELVPHGPHIWETTSSCGILQQGS